MGDDAEVFALSVRFGASGVRRTVPVPINASLADMSALLAECEGRQAKKGKLKGVHIDSNGGAANSPVLRLEAGQLGDDGGAEMSVADSELAWRGALLQLRVTAGDTILAELGPAAADATSPEKRSRRRRKRLAAQSSSSSSSSSSSDITEAENVAEDIVDDVIKENAKSLSPDNSSHDRFSVSSTSAEPAAVADRKDDDEEAARSIDLGSGGGDDASARKLEFGFESDRDAYHFACVLVSLLLGLALYTSGALVLDSGCESLKEDSESQYKTKNCAPTATGTIFRLSLTALPALIVLAMIVPPFVGLRVPGKLDAAFRICAFLLGGYMIYMFAALAFAQAITPICDDEGEQTDPIDQDVCNELNTGFNLVVAGAFFSLVATCGSICTGWDFYGFACSEI
jgi:hypothetical protein